MKVKICGLTSVEEAGYVNEYGADLAGIVLFFIKSKRNMEIEGAKEILAALRPEIKPVAVMVSPSLEQSLAAQDAGFSYLQIHGEIAPEILEKIRIPILKAYNIHDLEQWEKYKDLPQIAGYVLDAAEPGSGKAYDLEILKNISRDEKLFLLAGGLDAGNVAEAIREIAPDGVDVSSGVEYIDGRKGKDPERIEAFITAAKGC